MTRGMANRETVTDAIEDFELDGLTEADVNRAIGMLNNGKTEAEVLDAMEKWNAERTG